MVACPACTQTDNSVERTYSVLDAATHLLPAGRDPVGHARLNEALRALFDGDRVDVRRCRSCGLWFAQPFVAGTAEIYNLVTGGCEFYPSRRFEFELTIRALRSRPGSPLLEVGAGDGAFLRRARDAGVLERALATEYDARALASLRLIPGVSTAQRSLPELAADSDERFDAICMFQVLEHLDSVDEVFAALRKLTAGRGQLFISVPNADSVTAQEELTGFWEMPPNHIGRWTTRAIERVADRHGFCVLERRVERQTRLARLWELAKYHFQGRAYDPSTLAGRVNGLPARAVRGPIKRALTVGDLIMLAPHYGRIPPRSQWFRLGVV